MYTIENRQINTNSMTVTQAQNFYGRPRTIDELVHHWWNRPELRARTPENIYTWMRNNNRSVNYIVGWDDFQGRVRIIHMTPNNRVAITSHSANIFSQSIEIDPLITTSDPRAYELYKAVGWLHWQRERAYGKRLRAGLHKQYFSTECSPIDTTRIIREANKWRRGDYNPKPPKIEGAKVEYQRLAPNSKPIIYRFTRNAALNNFNHKRHADMEEIIKFSKGDTISIVGKAINKSVNSTYLMTAHSFGNADKSGQPNFTNGVNVVNLKEIKTTNPPAVDPDPKPEPKPKPEKTKAITYHEFDKPKYFLPKIDKITLHDFSFKTHNDMVPAGYVKYNEDEPIRIVGYAKHPTGSEYYMTEFSFNNSGRDDVPFRTTGFNKVDLEEVVPPSSTVPKEPPIEEPEEPPVPPSEDSIDRNTIIKFLESLISLIRNFIEGIRR